MRDNIDKLLDRGERIELLVQKTDDMSHHANDFKFEAKRLKRSMICKRLKCYLFIALIVLIIVGGAVMFVCGFPDFSNCAADDDDKDDNSKHHDDDDDDDDDTSVTPPTDDTPAPLVADVVSRLRRLLLIWAEHSEVTVHAQIRKPGPVLQYAAGRIFLSL